MSRRINDDDIKNANPFPDRDLDAWASTVAGKEIHRRIVDTDAVVDSGRRRSRRHYYLAAAATLSVLAVAATFVVRFRPPLDPLSVACYESLDRQADIAVLALKDERTPAEPCILKWSSAFGTPAPERVVTCVTDNDVLGVFPNDQAVPDETACASVAASLPSERRYGALEPATVRALQQELQSAFEGVETSSDCAPPGDLRETLQRVLDHFDAVEWSINDLTTDFALRENCAMFSLDPAGAAVLLIDGPTRSEG